jgi:putative hemolysin
MEIIILIICILISAFFSGSEAAFFSVSNLDVKRLVHTKRMNAGLLQNLKRDSHKFIITILIGNNVMNTVAAALATKIAIDVFGNAGVGIAVGVMTFLLLVFGEITPKAYCARNAESVSLIAAPIVHVLSIILSPVIWIFDKITKLALFFTGPGQSEKKLTEQTVIDFIEMSEEQGAIRKEETEMIRNVFSFDNKTAKDVLVPKEAVVMIPMTATPKTALRIMTKNGVSRVPVYDESPDHIVGILLTKDLLSVLVSQKNMKISQIMQKPFFVPDTRKINTILKAFQKRRQHMAIVVNEHGGIEGIVTAEDVIEELVGEIEDESDADFSPITMIKKNLYSVQGDCHVDVFNQQFTLSIPKNGYQTISGFVIAKLGRMPKIGDRVQHGQFVFEVSNLSRNKIGVLKVRKVDIVSLK